MHPNPQNVFVIGIGSGGTPYSVGVNPQIEHITAVEIVGAEIPVLREHARDVMGSPLRAFFDDPRVEVVIGDGRRELLLRQPIYDIIEADAIFPWRSHAGQLYSQEYFQEARQRLAAGGMMAQWSPTPRVRATFLSMFPYVIDVGNDILLGSDQPIDYDPVRIAARLDEPEIADYLNAGQIDIEGLRTSILAQTPVVWTPDTPRDLSDINTDLFPKDEYYLNTPRSS